VQDTVFFKTICAHLIFKVSYRVIYCYNTRVPNIRSLTQDLCTLSTGDRIPTQEPLDKSRNTHTLPPYTTQNATGLIQAAQGIIQEVRQSAEKKNKYVFTDGLLRINLRNNTPVIIPRQKIQNVIWTYHDHVLANHPGCKETYSAIKQRFY